MVEMSMNQNSIVNCDWTAAKVIIVSNATEDIVFLSGI